MRRLREVKSLHRSFGFIIYMKAGERKGVSSTTGFEMRL
jgi:uncharacterized protein YqgQ